MTIGNFNLPYSQHHLILLSYLPNGPFLLIICLFHHWGRVIEIHQDQLKISNEKIKMKTDNYQYQIWIQKLCLLTLKCSHLPDKIKNIILCKYELIHLRDDLSSVAHKHVNLLKDTHESVGRVGILLQIHIRVRYKLRSTLCNIINGTTLMI